jgi:predicted dehydrogenase
MSRTRLAVIGVGHLGRIHARLAKNLAAAELVAVVDPLPQAREEVAQQLGVPAADDYRQLIGQIDAAIIATPTRQHHAVACDLLSHGIHAFVEKPVTTSIADADELIELAQQRNLVLQVGHVERFNPAFVAAQPHVENPKYLEAVRCGPFTGRSTDIGVVLDLMIHDLDLILALVPSDVVAVDSLGAAVFGPNEDWAQARIVFECGSVAHLRASRVSQVPQRSLEAWCPDRHVRIDFATRQSVVTRHSRQVQTGQIDVQQLSAAERAGLQARLFTELLPVTELPVEDANAIAQEQQEFVTAIRTGGTVRVCGRAGRAALDVAERIIASIDTHRWDGTSHGPVGPRHEAIRRPLSGPHWSLSPAAAESRRQRRAG